MTTSTPRAREVVPADVVSPRPDRVPATTEASAAAAVPGHRIIDVLRIALGLVFLWAFVDKLFGLGYSTAGARSWLNGGSPTNGFLGHVEVGPTQSMFRSMAGNGLVDWLFMLALLGVGVALLTGVVLRLTAVVGSILMVLMWAAEWPLARFTSAGDPSGSTNPFIDYHLIYALGMIAVAVFGIASTWGLGHWWSQRKVVADHKFLL
ncbi:DoxX family membrane protein [Nakamurella lactea]|uniref:DoxX family membrane protein n=1 Tax=Nakamurella lactea TaxID=459515 RepID=UPI0004084ACF|nr:DoxX family membrane protein [Nakamurella lactea]